MSLDLKRIGASDYPTLADVDPYRTLIDLYARITLGLEAQSFPTMREAADWGNRLEPAVFDAWCDRMLRTQRLALRNLSRNSERRAWQRVTPDFLCLADSALVQVKCISRDRFKREHWGADGTDDVPDRIRVQVTGEIEALKSEPEFWCAAGIDPDLIDVAHVAVLVGGSQLRIFEVPYDAELGAILVGMAEQFWNEHVVPRRPPVVDMAKRRARG